MKIENKNLYSVLLGLIAIALLFGRGGVGEVDNALQQQGILDDLTDFEVSEWYDARSDFEQSVILTITGLLVLIVLLQVSFGRK